MGNQNKSSATWVVIGAVVLIFAGYAIYYLYPSVQAPSPATEQISIKPPLPEDSIASVESDLKGMSIEGLGSELADIEKELAQ